MKHSVWVGIALLLLTACKPSVPSDIIQPDDLEEILYDYHVSKAMASDRSKSDGQDFNRNKYFYAMLKKHGVTEAEFDSSLVYYYSHIDRLKDIYTEVNTRLADDAKALGASVGDISHYSQYGTTGDTANIWKEATDVLLMPRPTMNRYDFAVEVDTSFYKGDSFMFQFMSEYLWQSGAKDAVVCIVTKYEGDSIIQTANHVSVSGIAQIRVPANNANKLKDMRGFIYLSDGGDDADVRRMMFISQIQLIRFHNKIIEEKHETDTPDSAATHQTDSVWRGDNARGPKLDTLRVGTLRRTGGQPIPTRGGEAIHRMDAGAGGTKK